MSDEKLTIFTVRELNVRTKELLTEGFPERFQVKGEVSGLKKFGGTLYFSIKDEDSIVSGVMWKLPNKDSTELKDGANIVATAKIDLYIKNGRYQLQILSFEKVGLGSIHEKYLKMKEKYEKKGYFDETKKKKMPKYIKNIGIITSKDGAAIQDILSVLKDKKFQGNVYIKHSVVQGDKCPESIKEGIKFFQTEECGEMVDVILITRGGGSFEDLIGFSHKSVLRAIHKSNIYTISAVGHEIDFMLSDFVADLRAPTPSISAEFIARNNQKYWDKKLEKYDLSDIKNMIHNKLELYNQLFSEKKLKSSTLLTDIITKKIRIKTLWLEYKKLVKNKFNNTKDKFENLKNVISSLNPEKKLIGTAVVTDIQKNIIETGKDLTIGQKIIITLGGIKIECSVNKIN